MTGLPKLAYDPAEHPVSQRLDAWIRYMSYMHKVAPIEVPGRAFSAAAQSWVIDRFVFSHVMFDAQTITSTQGTSSVTGAPNILFGWYLRAGSAQVWHAGELLDIRDDTFYLFDYSREYHSITTQSEVISVMIPHAQIGYDPVRYPPHIALSRSSADGALVVGELERIVSDGDDMNRRDVPEEAERAALLFSSLLNRHRVPRKARPSRVRDIRRYIDARIFSEALTLDEVMATFEVPRSKVYQALGMNQNFDEYVTKRRLDYAFRSLAFGVPDPERMRSMAAHCHYGSTRAFAEAFEQQFNLPPSSILGAVNLETEMGEAPQSEELWQTWYSGAD